MFIRKGTIDKDTSSEKRLITNIYGKSYEVTHLMAFVWEKLDGNTTLNSINKEIKKIVRDENIHLSQLTRFLVEEMEKVDLVKPNDM